MKKQIFLGLLMFIGVSAFAADKMNPIITAVPSLSVTPDARAGGMGDVGAATSADVNAQYWNPSKYVFMKSSAGVSVNYTPWMKKIVNDINLMYLSGYYKIGDLQAVSASLRYFSLGDIDMTDGNGDNLGTTSPYEMSIDVAYSRLLSSRWSAAVALRYIRVDFGSVESLYPGNAFAADIAATYRMPITFGRREGFFAVGLDLSNIGTKISYDEGNTDYYLPANMRLGASFEYPIDEYNRISASLDLNKLMVPSSSYTTETQESVGEAISTVEQASDKSSLGAIFSSFSDSGISEEFKEIAWAVGLEYAYNNQFFVRTGYFYENEMKGNRKFWTFGAGFRLNMLQLDASYALASQTNPLDQTLRFSLSFDIDGLKDLLH